MIAIGDLQRRPVSNSPWTSGIGESGCFFLILAKSEANVRIVDRQPRQLATTTPPFVKIVRSVDDTSLPTGDAPVIVAWPNCAGTTGAGSLPAACRDTLIGRGAVLVSCHPAGDAVYAEVSAISRPAKWWAEAGSPIAPVSTAMS